MTTSLELFEGLSPLIGEDAARMIAEALPLTDRLVTKSDLDAALAGLEARIYRWILTFNATLFLGLAGMIVAILVKR